MDTNRLANLLESAAAAIAVARLIYLGLAGRFPALTGWLALLSLTTLILTFPDQQSATYFYVWLAALPLESLAGILAVRELFAVVFRDYPGIRSGGRVGMYAGLVAASAGTFAINRVFHAADHRFTPVYVFETVHRTIVFSLAVIIAAILIFLSRHPLRLGQNSYISSSFFGAMFLSEALRLLIDSLEVRLNNSGVDAAEAIFLSVCMVLWASLLHYAENPQRERTSQPTLRETQLLGQLTALNQILARSARR